MSALQSYRARAGRHACHRKAETSRAARIRAMRDREEMTWQAIGRRFRITAARACAIYRHS